MSAHRVVEDLSDTRIMHSDGVQNGHGTTGDRIQSLCSCLVLLSACRPVSTESSGRNRKLTERLELAHVDLLCLVQHPCGRTRQPKDQVG